MSSEGNLESGPTANGNSPTVDGLAVMDEIYEAGEDSDLSDFGDINAESDSAVEAEDEADVALESTLIELLESVQDCVEIDDHDKANDEPRLEVDKAFSEEAINFLISNGTLLFLGKYLLQVEDTAEKKYTVPELLAALGFRLPLRILNDPKFTSHHFEVALQVAIRYTLKHRQRLPQPRTLDEVASAISKAQRILVVTGAGISTSLGIPDFRSDNGLYAQLEHLGLADPQEVFDIRIFREDPSIFYSVAAKILPEQGLHSGTPTHRFIKLLHDQNKLLRNYTQNIDNLEQYIGLPHDKVVQCHGSFGSAHCITCGYALPVGEQLFPTIKRGEIPRCPECEERNAKGKRKRGDKNKDSDDEDDDLESASRGVLKPDITFFGESLPARFDHMLFDEGDAANCDLIICIGTSLRVSPVSEIVKVVPRQVPQIYISRTPAKHVTFEVSFLGGCDDVVELLCQKLNWSLDHPMNKRPAGMSLDEYPQGRIEHNDGVFRFVDASEAQIENTESIKEEISESDVANEPAKVEQLTGDKDAVHSEPPCQTITDLPENSANGTVPRASSGLTNESASGLKPSGLEPPDVKPPNHM